MHDYGQMRRGFAWHLQLAGRAPATQRLYLAALDRWAAAVGDVRDPDPAGRASWLRSRRAQLAARSLNLELAALRAFYRWAVGLELARATVADWIPRARPVPRRLPRPLDDAQIGALLAAPDLSTPLGLRDHLILRLLYETGARAAELAALDSGCLVGRELALGFGTRRARWVPVSEELVQLIGCWRRLRRPLVGTHSAALLVSGAGRALGAREIWRVVDRAARRALDQPAGALLGIGRARAGVPWTGTYPHRLRESCAAALIARGVDLRAVQTLLGHASLGTTAVWLAADLDTLRREHAKRFPARAPLS